MSASCQQIDLLTLRINLILSESLYGIRMEQNIRIIFLHNPDSLIDRLHCSYFVIHIHDGNQNCLVTQRLFQSFQLDASHAVHRKIGHTKAFFLFQITHRIQNRRMLYR